MDLGDLSYLVQDAYDRWIVSQFAPATLEETVLRNMQITVDDLIEGKARYDVKTAEKMSWSHLASKKGICESEMKVISYGNVYSLISVLSNKNVKLIVVLMTNEYYKTIAPILKLANSPRGFHKGSLFLRVNGKELILLDRREAWFLLPEKVIILSTAYM